MPDFTVKEISSILSTLDGVEVKGIANWERMLAVCQLLNRKRDEYTEGDEHETDNKSKS